MAQSLWKPVTTKTFDKLYRSKDAFMKKKTREVIKELAQSNNPLSGPQIEKIGPAFWTFRLSSSDRLAYFIRQRELVLVKVCSHKEVLGRG